MSGRNTARRFRRHCRRNWCRSMARVSVSVVWRALSNLPRHFQKQRLLPHCRNNWAGARTRKGSQTAQWAHGNKGGNEDLRCQAGISSSLHLVPARAIMRSRLVAASIGRHLCRSQTVTRSRLGESSRSQFVILKVHSGWRQFFYTFSPVAQDPKGAIKGQKGRSQQLPRPAPDRGRNGDK